MAIPRKTRRLGVRGSGSGSGHTGVMTRVNHVLPPILYPKRYLCSLCDTYGQGTQTRNLVPRYRVS